MEKRQESEEASRLLPLPEPSPEQEDPGKPEVEEQSAEEPEEMIEEPAVEESAVPEGFISLADAERMAADAYERGRRKAVEVEWGEIAPRKESITESAESQSDIERLFRRRPSVWDMVATASPQK